MGERQRESMTIFMRLLKCCLFVSLLVALQPPVPPSTVIDEAHDRLQAAAKCNLLCAPVRTITIVRLPCIYLATGFVMLVLLGMKGTMQTWLVHKSLGCSQFLRPVGRGGSRGFARTPLLAPKGFYIHCYSTF